MSTRDQEQPGERWYGAQDAAQYLGIHRSTLHLAVHRGSLIPDRTTPGKHLRFRQETLDRFKLLMQRSAVTSEDAALAPLSAIARITSGISAREAADDICRSAVESVQHAQPGIDGVAVVLINRETEPPQLRMVAQVGLTREFIGEQQRLYTEGVELAITHVLETLEPEEVPDTEAEQIRMGSSRLARVSGLRAYAVYPLLQGHYGLGALILVSHTPHRFRGGDRLFLTAVASELAVAIRIDTYLALTRDLILTAMGRAVGPEITEGKLITRLAELRELMVGRTAAEDACALGFDDGDKLKARHARLGTLAREAREKREYLHRSWRERGTLYTGMAVGLALYDEHTASVGVLWQGARPSSRSDESLLLVFAGACALASGRVRLDARDEAQGGSSDE